MSDKNRVEQYCALILTFITHLLGKLHYTEQILLVYLIAKLFGLVGSKSDEKAYGSADSKDSPVNKIRYRRGRNETNYNESTDNDKDSGMNDFSDTTRQRTDQQAVGPCPEKSPRKRYTGKTCYHANRSRYADFASHTFKDGRTPHPGHAAKSVYWDVSKSELEQRLESRQVAAFLYGPRFIRVFDGLEDALRWARRHRHASCRIIRLSDGSVLARTIATRHQ